MKTLFYLGLAGLILFEMAKVYFIMPMPGSQRMRSIDLAYALHQYRWAFRLGFGLLALLGTGTVFRGRRKWVPAGVLVAAAGLVYVTNFVMAADSMFYHPERILLQPAKGNKIDPKRLVLGIVVNGAARAYPIQLLGYHHQVRDTVGGKPVLATYCTVCRTGRVFEPLVNGRTETFRLVGMDHFNALFEDQTTGSWWRQANGEAIAGPLTGQTLPEVPSVQTTLREWLRLHPTSRVLQPDPAFADRYSKDFKYEDGTSRKDLTGTDSVSWRDKSWVVGVQVGKAAKAYDWNRLRRERLVHDMLDGTPVLLVLAHDGQSFFAYRRPDAGTRFTLRGDSLVAGTRAYDLAGRSATDQLRPLPARQEFWHSWRTFQPGTARW